MKYYSTNKKAPTVTLEEAVIKGLAPDRGLYMPEHIQKLPATFFNQIEKLSFQEIAFEVSKAFFGGDIEIEALRNIVYDTLSFDVPAVHIEDNIYSLELFHGPTLAFKDVGARFMARLLQYFIRREGQQQINVLVATSGDTGSAVANDCQAMIKQAFMDETLNHHMKLTSANSINVARFLPQAFYYFYAYAQLKRLGKADKLVISVPSGNFGNLCAGLFAYKMGLPVNRFIAANNANDVFFHYLRTGEYMPQPSRQTLANAMDVGNPSNFARIYTLFNGCHQAITELISGATYTDDMIRKTMQECYASTDYILDPHGACGYKALKEQLQPSETGLFLETAHPAKFKDKVDEILSTEIAVPERLAAFMKGTKQSIPMDKQFETFKQFLMDT